MRRGLTPPARGESIAKGRDHRRRPPGRGQGDDDGDDESNNNMVDVMFPRNAHNHAASAPSASASSPAAAHPPHQVMTRGSAYLPPHPAHHAQPPFSHFGRHFHHPGHQGHVGHLLGHAAGDHNHNDHSQQQQYQVPPNAHVGSSQPQRAHSGVVHHLPQPPHPGFGNNKYKNKLFNARQEDRINYHRTRRATGGGGEEENRGGGGSGNEAALAAAAAATAAAAASANKSHAAPRPRHLSVASEVRVREWEFVKLELLVRPYLTHGILHLDLFLFGYPRAIGLLALFSKCPIYKYQHTSIL